jgi:hypothetical protein
VVAVVSAEGAVRPVVAAVPPLVPLVMPEAAGDPAGRVVAPLPLVMPEAEGKVPAWVGALPLVIPDGEGAPAGRPVLSLAVGAGAGPEALTVPAVPAVADPIGRPVVAAAGVAPVEVPVPDVVPALVVVPVVPVSPRMPEPPGPGRACANARLAHSTRRTMAARRVSGRSGKDGRVGTGMADSCCFAWWAPGRRRAVAQRRIRR